MRKNLDLELVIVYGLVDVANILGLSWCKLKSLNFLSVFFEVVQMSVKLVEQMMHQVCISFHRDKAGLI